MFVADFFQMANQDSRELALNWHEWQEVSLMSAIAQRP
jgi:hypothetical protein